MKSYWEKVKFEIINWILYVIIYISNLTLRIKVIGKENLEKKSPLIISVWHRYIWIIVYYFRYKKYYTLASLSKDGEYISSILNKLGWQVIRGSSSKGGARSLIKLYKNIKKNCDNKVVLTPDGPTGPLYKIKPGIIYLQEKTDGYITPLGIAVAGKKEANSWDKFVIPYPFTRVVLVIGEPVKLPETKSIKARAEILELKMEQVKQKADKILSGNKQDGRL
ncbi:MAG: lysophospholipid acyltransferase family protein [Halanaerobiales bacterium]